MSDKLPRLSAKEIVPILEKIGFSFSRQNGSHMIYKNLEGIRATIPYHGNKTLHPKIIKNILNDTHISVEELKKLL